MNTPHVQGDQTPFKDHRSCSKQHLAILKQPRSKAEEGQSYCVLVTEPSLKSSSREGWPGERRRIIPPLDFVQTGSPWKSGKNPQCDPHDLWVCPMSQVSTHWGEGTMGAARAGQGTRNSVVCHKPALGLCHQEQTKRGEERHRDQLRAVSPGQGRVTCTEQSHLHRTVSPGQGSLTWTGQLPGQRQSAPSARPRCCSAPGSPAGAHPGTGNPWHCPPGREQVLSAQTPLGENPFTATASLPSAPAWKG